MQACLFPSPESAAARERYNPVGLTSAMTMIRSPLSSQELALPLAASLASELGRMAADLRLQISPARISTESWRLLAGSEEWRAARPEVSCAASPSVPFDEMTFEPHDYLHLVPVELRRALGQVMTPPQIVKYILDGAGYRQGTDILGKTLCDPACGSGAFLVEAVRTFLGALKTGGVPPAEWYPRAVARFSGFDIDPLACLYARFNLSLLLGRALLLWLEAHPRRIPSPLPIHRLDTLETLAEEMSGGHTRRPLTASFDFVVGNPPYLKVSPLSPSLRDAFQDSLYGHPNAYGMFLHAGIELLRPAGRLGYIVPRSMLSGLYFQRLRRLIEERACLDELSLIAERKNVFPKVLQGTMILVLRKPATGEMREPDRPIRTGILRKAEDFEPAGSAQVTARTTQVTRRLNGSTIWFVSDQERTYSLLDKIIGRHPLLGGPAVACPARTGPIVWNRVKPLLRPRPGEGRLPLVWATDVSRFRFELASAGETRPPYLEATQKVRDLSMVGTSLLIQRITADEQARRIVASRSHFPVRQPYFVENHLNVIQPAPAAGVDLHYLLGILSSDIVEFLFRSMNGNTQVSATELNLLPVPRGAFETEIGDAAAAIETTDGRARRADREGELNEKVARAYGLTGRDLQFLQRVLSENPAFRGARRDA